MGALDRPRRKTRRGAASQKFQEATRAQDGSKPTTHSLAKKIMGALYWDILCVTQFKQIVSQNSANISNQDITQHQSFFHEAHAFITNFVHGFLSPRPQGRDVTMDRCVNFLGELGWKVFAICAYSEGFRHAILNDDLIRASDKYWDALRNLISENKRSIEIFARTRGLNWQEVLLSLTMYEMQGLPNLKHVLAPEIDISTEHPHQVVQTKAGGLRRPRYKGRTQRDVPYRVHKSRDGSKSTRLTRKKHWGRCDICLKTFINCDCRVHSLAGELTELVEYGDKGVGVRALASFQENDVLGEYVGMILPGMDCKDHTYAMSIRQPKGKRALAIADSAHLGNWTRFMNHSCDAPATFQPFIAGPETTTVATAHRRISMFEEVTVHYGDEYWGQPSRCPCGSDNCMSLQDH